MDKHILVCTLMYYYVTALVTKAIKVHDLLKVLSTHIYTSATLTKHLRNISKLFDSESPVFGAAGHDSFVLLETSLRNATMV